MHRAAHQMLEDGAIFRDPLAIRILDAESQDDLEDWAGRGGQRGMRLFIASRTRFAEDRLELAVERGTRQVVIVGAGLDTMALRNENGRLIFYEVDHPATQAWKRELIESARIKIPRSSRFVPVDFEREKMGERLAEAGFEAREPAYFVWLGVVPYLTEAAIFATLEFIASVPGGEVVFDYPNPPEQLTPPMREWHKQRALRAESVGEPWISYFDTETLHHRLGAMGAVEIEDLGPDVWRGDAGRYFGDKGGHIIRVRW
jgi:methyltransferase (TIGR00027 family)